ncbi:hypothetical protein Q5P01_011575 [Channa striata]|uniref:Uncharacterized protein n=1 Tax=Channa striata TaxID=64152 RepID=A0AA88SPC1_CHASR|nr:hypothetical protein Q5P01_011575 [Channa striata]
MEMTVRSEVILSVYIISFLIGLPANLLALYAFSVKIHSKPVPIDILLLNLIVSDLLFLIILPLKMHEAASGMKWNLPIFLCSITAFTFFSSIYTSVLVLTAVSVLRYIAVAYPVTYHHLHKPLYAIVISAVIWIISTAHCSITLITQLHPNLANKNSTVCYENFTDKQLEILLPVRLEMFFVLCLVPLLICVYCYMSCIWILYSHPRISRKKKEKAIGMALGTLAVFLICVFPYNLSHLVGYIEGKSPKWRVVMEQVVRSEVILSVYIISFLIGLPANLLALYAFSIKIHSKPVPIDILLLNLIVSDLLFLFILPLKMHEAASGMKWNLPNFLCSITSFTFFASIDTSALFLSAVSVLRYIAVAYPVTYHLLFKPVYAIVISAVIWIISTAHCSIILIIQLHPNLANKNSTVCYENFTDKQLEILLPVRLELFFVLCLVPLIICVYCYISCIWILYSRPRISQMQKQKAIGMALGTLAVFLICMLPFSLSHLVGYIEGKSPKWRVVMEIIVRSEVILSVYIISFLIGLPANLLALYAFSVKIHSKPVPIDILLLNLIVSDLLFLITLPLKMHEAASGMKWNLPNFLCSITAFTFFSSIYTSSFLLTAVSVLRYIGVAYPVTYHHLHKPVYGIAISAVIWIISTAHCSITFIIPLHPNLANKNSTVCYENFTEEQLEILLPVRLEMFFVLCLVPLIICVYCYISCIWILYSRPRISRMQKQKAIGMALGTLAVFLICMLPFSLSHLVGYIEAITSLMGAPYLIRLLSLSTAIQQVGSWTIKVPTKITAVEGSCVIVPCQTEPHSEVIWYEYHGTNYPVVFGRTKTNNIAKKFRGRTSVLGEAKDGNCTLRINDVRPADNNLKVYVWINPGSKQNQRFYDQTVTIVVERKTPIISIQEHIVAGQIFQANCSINYSCPFSVPLLHWSISTVLKNSTLIVFNEETAQWLYTNTLYVLGTYEMHKTKIWCSAEFKSFITESSQKTLSILYKPVAVNLIGGEEPVTEGGSVTTECGANANPRPHMYSWLRRQMDQINNINSTERNMSFSNIKRHTSVSCIAHNDIGFGQSNWLDLDVQYVPEILPESLCHLTEEVLRCICRAEASPNASIYWTLDGNLTLPLSFSFVSTNEKNVVSGELLGSAKNLTNVTCTAWNSFGSDTALLNISNLSKAPYFAMWFFASLVVGTALLFGCALCISRKYSTNRQSREIVRNSSLSRPQNYVDNVQLQQRWTPRRSQDKQLQLRPCKPQRNSEEERFSCIYENECIEKRRVTRPQQSLITFTAGVVMEQVVRSEVILSVYIISFLIGLPANLLALYAFSVKIHSKPVPIDILLLNLIVSDLLFLIILPLKMHEAASGMKWNLPNFLCSITAFTFFSTIYTSALLLSAVSVLRYIGVAYPVTYHHLHKPVYAIVISAVVWIISTAHCSITFIVQLHPSLTNKNSTFCYEKFTPKQLEILLPVRLEMFFVLCLVPLMICVYCYMSCIWILYSRPRISQMQKQKAIGMALGTLAVFLICMLPYNISHLVGYIEGESPKWRYYALLLSTFNTCIDPIIFYFSSSSFQCTSLPANLLALYAFSVKIHSKPVPIDILLLNLAVSDLLFLFILPLKMHEAASVGYIEGKSPTWRYYTLLVSTFNTCIDPIIFYFSSSSFQCTSEKFIFRKRKVNVSPLEMQGTGLPANLLALYAFSVKIHSKPVPIDILLLNLTVSDLLFLFNPSSQDA